jgi:AAA domain
MFDQEVKTLLEDEQVLALQCFEEDLKGYIEEKSPSVKVATLKVLVERYRSLLGFTQQDIISLSTLHQIQEDQDDTSTLTLKQLLELQNDSPTWLVPDLVAAGGGLYIVAGAPKTGKTLIFVYQLAYSVAVSGNFLGMPCQKGKVLIFECEESSSKVSRTFRSKGLSSYNKDAVEAIDGDFIRVVNNFDIGSDIKKLKSIVRDYQPSLIIFDSLRAVTKNLEVSENSSDMSKHLYILQKACNYLKVPGVIIHHMSKNGRERGIEGVAGSLSLSGASDGVIMLYRAENAPGHSVELMTVPREGVPVNWVIERQRPKTGYWEYTVVEDKGVNPDQLRIERKILRFMANNPGTIYTRKDLSNELGFDSDNYSFYNAVDRLIDSLQIAEEQLETGLFGVWISATSPWANITTSPLSDDFAQADKLTQAKSKQEIDSIVAEWTQEYKMKIWGLLSTVEQEKLLHFSNPCRFQVDNWVKEKSTDELHQIKDKRFDSKEKIWFYTVEGEREFEESHLEISLDYSEARYDISI